MCRYICVNISIFWYIHIYVFMRYYTCCFIPENHGAHFWAHSGEWNTFPYVKNAKKKHEKHIQWIICGQWFEKKMWNLKLPRVFTNPNENHESSPTTYCTRIKRNQTSRNTHTHTQKPIKLKNKKPAHCSLLGMFDLTGLRGCLWWLFGSCIANCRGGGTKLGASEASEAVCGWGWGDRSPEKWGCFRCKRGLLSRELTYPTYPTLGKWKSSSKCHFLGGYVSFVEGISYKRKLIPSFQPSFSSDLFFLFFRGV